MSDEGREEGSGARRLARAPVRCVVELLQPSGQERTLDPDDRQVAGFGEIDAVEAVEETQSLV